MHNPRFWNALIARNWRKLLLPFLLVLLVKPGFGQAHHEKLDQFLDSLNRNGEFTGTVLVARNDSILYHYNAGYADIEHNVRTNDSTRFELASITKVFTAILVLQLVENGKIKLSGKISDYIPGFSRQDSGQITIHNLLSHTSGIQDFVGLNCPFSDWKESDFFTGLAHTPINFSPGAKFEYASSTYILLRFIIEHVTGKSYEENLRQRILEPAHMFNSGLIADRKLLNERAMGYVFYEKSYHNSLPILNHYIFTGAASIYSTAGDLLKFDRALYSGVLLTPSSVQKMYSTVMPPYGYGWFIEDDPKFGKTVSHGGDIFGFTTLIERGLKQKSLIVLLANQQSVDRGKIADKLRLILSN